MQRDLLFHPAATLAAAADDYLLACRIARKTPKTIRFYRQALDQFLAFAGPAPPGALDAKLLRRFLAHLDDRGLSARTQRNYLVAVKTFVTWLDAEGDYGVDAAFLARVAAPRVEEHQPEPFTAEEQRRLFAATRHYRDGGWQGQRLRAIMAVLLDTGIRATSLVSLRLADVDLATGELRLRAESSKTRREQVTWLGLRAKKEVVRWWQARRHQGDPRPESPFFVGWNDRAMSYDTLYHLLHRHGERAGVPDCRPHRFRHTFTFACIEAGMDLFTVQTLLGHSDLTMTRRYFKQKQARVGDEKRAKSPLDQLGGRW